MATISLLPTQLRNSTDSKVINFQGIINDGENKVNRYFGVVQVLYGIGTALAVGLAIGRLEALHHPLMDTPDNWMSAVAGVGVCASTVIAAQNKGAFAGPSSFRNGLSAQDADNRL